MKVLNFKENLRRIEKIKAMQDMKDGTVKLIGFDDWLYSDDESACFADYFDKKTKIYQKKRLLFWMIWAWVQIICICLMNRYIS